ncbi:MAG: septal ring lytic transglycosylase RlpA family protein [Pseudomonadota bacterium]|nr:septal ring lytic transglycosylase RlpA family protein [Pseudomonadota bacterium]
MLAILALTPLTALGKVSPGFTQKGIASYYSDKLHGRKTASGERYDKTAYTAAHRTLPLGTRVRVTNIKTGKSIELRINDRGPFVKGRIIDLSRRAARDLGMIRKGLGRVRVQVLSLPGRKKS